MHDLDALFGGSLTKTPKYQCNFHFPMKNIKYQQILMLGLSETIWVTNSQSLETSDVCEIINSQLCVMKIIWEIWPVSSYTFVFIYPYSELHRILLK